MTPERKLLSEHQIEVFAKAIEERAERRSNGCWVWTPRVDRLTREGEEHYVTRLSWAIYVGEGCLPAMDIARVCDTPNCIEPTHLEAHPRRRTPKSRTLTPQQVWEARMLYWSGAASQRAIARDLGVSQPAVSEMVRGITYADCPGPTKGEA